MEILTKEQQELQANQRVSRAVQGGLQFVIDETVTASIKHSGAIEDLKWLLRMLLSGEFGINMDPKNAGGQPLVPAVITKMGKTLALRKQQAK